MEFKRGVLNTKLSPAILKMRAKRRRRRRGGGGLPNVIINGTFDSDTDWNKAAGWTIIGGVAQATATTGNLTAIVPPLTVGITYRVKYTISDIVAGTVRVGCGGTTGSLRSGNGTYEQDITCTVAGSFYFDV